MSRSFAPPLALLFAPVPAAGVVPLDVLERNVDDWIAAQKAK